MDRWKSRGAESQTGAVRGEKSQKRKDQKKEDAGVRKGREVAKHCVFSMFCGSGGSKSRLAKAAGAETSGEMRNEKLHAVVVRSRFWSEKVQSTWVSEHFWKLRCRKSARPCGAKHISKSKCTKHTILGPLFGSCDVEKVHAVVARSTFRSQNVQSTRGPDHFWKLRCRKSARRCGAKHMSKSKCTKQTRSGPLLAVEMSKKCTPLWREARFEVKMYKALHVRATFGGSDVVLRGRRKGLCTLSKVSKTWRFCSISRNDGRRGAFEEDLQRCISRGRCSTEDMFIRDVRRSGRSFPERGCILEYQIFRFAEMILRDRCSTSHDLASIFVAGTVLYTGGMKKSQNALVRGYQRCTQLSIFGGSLAELLCFWRC